MMNAKAVAFFSGFPERRFTDEIAKELREILADRKSLVFISAWPDQYKRNDEDSEGMHNMFAIENMPFSSFSVIDERTELDTSKRQVETASCLFLMGGNATMQMDLIKRKGLFDKIKAFKGVILGVSAGSMNMGNPVVDIYESLVPYEGFAFAHITIKAHYPIGDPNLMQSTNIVSMEMPVTLMKDESAIFIIDDQIKIVGEIYRLNRGEITPFKADDLTQK